MNLTNVLFDAIIGLIQKFLLLIMNECFDVFISMQPDANDITNFPLYDGILMLMKSLSMSLLVLITIFEAFKSYFIEFGMRGQEPIKILGKMVVSAFFIAYLNEILLWGITVTNEVIKSIAEIKQTQEIKSEDFVSAFLDTGTKGVTNLLINIFIMILIYYMVKLVIKMYLRIIMMSLIVMFSPLASACILSENLTGFFDGMKKLYIGNLIIQILQTTCILFSKFLLVSAASGNAGTKFYNIAMLIAVLKIVDSLEEIIRDMSISVGLNKDIGGGLQKLGSTAYSLNMIKTVFVK